MANYIYLVIKCIETSLLEQPIKVVIKEFKNEDEAEDERMWLHLKQLTLQDEQDNWCTTPLVRFIVEKKEGD
jgi:hypothetical protein